MDLEGANPDQSLWSFLGFSFFVCSVAISVHKRLLQTFFFLFLEPGRLVPYRTSVLSSVCVVLLLWPACHGMRVSPSGIQLSLSCARCSSQVWSAWPCCTELTRPRGSALAPRSYWVTMKSLPAPRLLKWCRGKDTCCVAQREWGPVGHLLRPSKAARCERCPQRHVMTPATVV